MKTTIRCNGPQEVKKTVKAKTDSSYQETLHFLTYIDQIYADVWGPAAVEAASAPGVAPTSVQAQLAQLYLDSAANSPPSPPWPTFDM